MPRGLNSRSSANLSSGSLAAVLIAAADENRIDVGVLELGSRAAPSATVVRATCNRFGAE